MDKILFDDERSDRFVNAMVCEILDKVKTDHVRATVVWEPNHIELSVEPWEPYRMECPYGKK